MGTCSSKDQIEKSVISPPRSLTRPRSKNVNVPTTSSSPFPDARHEYSTVTGHLRTEPKDIKDDEDVDDHTYFPHEAETPEVLSARSSTKDEKSDIDRKVHTSAAFESSEEYATSKELQMSAHPGSLPDDYHDALDKFGKSLTDSHILKSETKPLHEFKSAENDAIPLTSRSLTERKSMSEKSIIVSKHEPLQSAAAPSKEAKDPATAFATREQSHGSTATYAAPKEVGNLSTRNTAEARETVASIQGQAKVSEISPAIKTATEFAISSFEQQPVSIPDLTEKGGRSETVPATSPATDIAANLPTTDSEETTEPTVETEKCDEESHTDLYTDATKEEDGANGTAFKGVRLLKLECDNENRDFHRKINTDEQRDLSNIKVCGEPAMAQTPNAAQEVVENFPTKNDAMQVEQTIPLEESKKKSITAPATGETMEPNVLNTYQVKQDARIGEPESSHVGNVVITKIRSIDVLSPAMEDRQCGEPAMAQTPNAAQVVVQNFPTKSNVMLAEQTIPLEESQKKIITAPATDETVEPNVLNTCQVKQDARIGEPESSHVENVVMTKIRSIDQQETVLSPAMEDQHAKAQSNPANITTTEVVGVLPTKENEQIAYLAASINKQKKETSRALASDVTTEGTVLQIDAATKDKGMGHENSNKRNVEKTESTVDDEQQLTLSPALEEHHKKLQSDPFINDVKDGEMLHTRNNAWEADPTITSGELHKVLHPTATEARKDVDVTALNTAAQGQFMDIQSIKVGKAEETASIYDEKKQESPLEEKGKDPYPAPPANVITENANVPMMDRTNATLQTGEHHKLSCTTTTIKKDILAEAVLDVEIECKDVKVEKNNKNIDVDMSSPSLKKKYEESDTAQPTISALAVIKTFNAKDDTVELKQIIQQEELQKEFNTTSVIDATVEVTNEERGDAKVEELESSGVQDLKEPESRIVDQQETVLHPVYQTEESHISPVIAPVTKVDGLLPTINSMQTTELTITTDEKNKESSSALDANVKTEEDSLLIKIAREAKGSEHGRNNGENTERTQSTSAEQQSHLSPALEEQHEESQTFSDINAAKQVPESVHSKENAWEANPMIPSEELHDHSHMAVTKIKMEEDAIAIDGAAKGEATKLESSDVENAQGPPCPFVNKEQLHSLPAIEEQGQQIDQTLDIDGVTEIVERLTTITGTDISGIQDRKEPESRSTDEHQTISYPSLVDQREESYRIPDIVSVTKIDQMFPTNNEVQTTDLTITTDENHKQCRRAPDDNVRTEEDALVINATREAEGLEHESNIDKNAEMSERTNAEQRSILSPVLEEEHEDPQTRSDINEAKDISETVHRKDNAWEADPMIPSKELYDQSHAAATETKIEEDTTAINGVEEGESTEPESNKVENAQETAGLCVNKEQLHSPPAIEEQGQETNPTPDNDGVTEVFENVAITNGKRIMGIQDLKQPDSRSIDQQETISYPSLVNQTEVSKRSPIVPVKEVDGMFPTNNEAQIIDLPITTDEKHKESSRAPDANVRTKEDALLTDAAREPENLEHERNNDENTVMTETTNAEQLSTLSPDFEEQHEDSQTCSEINAANEIPETVRRKENTWATDPVISSELPDQSHTAATKTKLEEDYIAINGIEKDEAMELESNNVENAEEPSSLCVNKEQSHSPPATEIQAQETHPALDTDGIRDNAESLDSIIATHISGIQYLKEPESRNIVQQEPISYPSLVDQTEESHRTPVIIPVTKADGMSPTNNEVQKEDLTITADENHKETRRAPDDNVRTEKDALLINAAREAEGLEHERNIDKNAEREESTIAEQQSTLSPALEEEHEDPQTCSDIDAANKTSENVHGKENAWEADPMIPSKELHDQSDTAATETNVEEDAIAINGVEKGEGIELESNKVENTQEPASLCVKKEELHSPPAMEEQGREIDPTLDTNRVSEVVTSLATINGTHIMGVQDLKEPESRSIDQQKTISYPSLVYQTEESHQSPVIVPVTEVGVFLTDNEAKTTDLPITTDEKHKESSRVPDANVRAEEDALLSNAASEADAFHIDRVAEDRDIKHEKDNGKNAEKTKTTGVDEEPLTSYPALEEQHEEPKASLYIHVGIEIPKTIHTQDIASEEDLTIAPRALHKYSDITASEMKIEVDITAINEVAEREGVEAKSNKVEKAEEPASKYVDRQKPCSPAAMEENVESDLARATHVVNDIAESLPMMDETTTAVQTENHHKETDITPIIRIDAHTADMMLEMAEQHKEYGRAPAIDAITEDKRVEHESDNGENEEKTQTTGADKQPSSVCPTLEEKHEESKVSPYINAVTELDNESASDLTVVFEELHKHSYTVNSESKIEMDVHSISGVYEGNVVEVKSNKVEKAEELASKYVDKHQSHSPAAMEEHVEDTDSAPTTRAVKEIAENLPMLDETTAVQTEKHHEESNMTTLTDLEGEDAHTADLMVGKAEQDKESSRAPCTDAITENKGVEHESDDGRNTEKTETTGVDEQHSTLSPALEEQHEEPQSSLYINTATAVPKTHYTWDNASEANLIFATYELQKHSDTASDREIEVDLTASDEVAERKVLEEKSNLEEKAEEPESKYVDKKQSHVPTSIREQVEDSDLAPTISALKEIAENLPMMDETTTILQKGYHHKDSHITLLMDSTKDEDVLANSIAVKAVEVAESKVKVAEKGEKLENADADEQKSVSSPILKKKCEEIDATQTTDTAQEAAETFADDQKSFSSSVLQECEETDTTEATDMAPEAAEASNNEQKTISSSVLKEKCEETDTSLATNTAQETVETFVNEQISFSSLVLKECEEANSSEATDTAPEAVKAFADEQKTTPSSVLKENCEETDATQTTDTAPEAAENFVDEQQKFSYSGLQECEETHTTEATDATPEAVESFVDEPQSISSSVLKEICKETDIAEATDTAQEAKEPHKEINMTLTTDETTGAGVENQRNHENVDADQQQSLSSLVLEENSEETDTTQVSDTTSEAVETFGDEQQKVSPFAVKECEETDTTEATDTEPEAAETYNNQQKSISSSVLKENCKETDIAQATDTAPEVIETIYVNKNVTVAKETMVVKEPHKEFNMTPITNPTTDTVVENERKRENIDADKQQSVSSPVLKEKYEETDSTLATNTTQEAVETFTVEQQSFSSSVFKECEETITSEATDTAPEAIEAFADEQKSTPSSVLKEDFEETGATQSTDTTPEVVENIAAKQQNLSSSVLQEREETDTTEDTNTAPETVETFADEQQSISSSVLKENCEETDKAEVTVTEQETVENFDTNDNEMGTKEIMEVKEPHQEINMTIITDAAIGAGVETHENVDADQQQSVSSPVLEENSDEKRDTTQATDTALEALETFGDEQQKFSSFALREFEEKDATEATDTEPETAETSNNEQKTISSSVLKENCEETDTTLATNTAQEAVETFVDEQISFTSLVLKECEEKNTSEATDTAPEAVKAFADEQKSTPSSVLKEKCEETDATQPTDTAPEAAENFVDEQQNNSYSGLQECEETDTTEATDAAPEAVETFVDEPQSISSSVLKGICEDTDIAEATDTAKEAKEPHKEINMTLITDATTGAGVENQRNHENVDADQQQILSSPVLEENSEETDTTQVSDTASEALETFGDEQQKVSSFAVKECEETDTTEATDSEPEAAETFINQHKSISSSVLKENCKETDIAQATDTAPEVIENIYVNKNVMIAKETMVVKEPHKEFNMTPIINPTTDTVVEYERKHENIDSDKQQSVSSPVLKEKYEETDSTLATNTTQGAVETFGVEQQSFSSSVLKECEETITSVATDTAPEAVEAFADEQKSTPSSVLKEDFEETDATQSTDTTPDVVENIVSEQQNPSSSVLQEREETDTTEDTNTAPKTVETFVDEQQSISSSVLKENCEETDIAEATVTEQEAVENFDTNDNETVTKEIMEVIESQKEINMTLITIATTGAGVENQKNHENVDADQQQSGSSPVLKENSKETDTIQATDTASEALETFADKQQKFSSFALKELEETDTTEATDTEPEAAETFNNKQKSISSSVLEENYEETDIAQASDTAAEVIENFYVNENPMVEKEAMLVKEPHKEFNMTAITNATTDIVVENERNHENTDAYKQQSVSSPYLKEKCQETDTTLATNTAQEAVKAFAHEQQRFSCSVLKECEETNTSEATDTAPEAVEAFDDEQKNTSSSVLKETCDETNIPQDTDTAPDAVESFYTNENRMVAKETMAVKEPHKEFKMTLITNATTDADVPVMDEIKENAKVQELESGSDETIKEPESRWLDHQKSFLSSAMEEEREESHTNLVNSGTTEIVGILPTKNDAQTADPMMSTEENHENSNKAPDTDLKIEADSLFINAVTEEKYAGHESSYVENAKEMITTGPHEPHSTLSPPSKEQHAESEASQAIKEVTEICETIDTWAIAQTKELMIYSEQHHEKSDTISPHETTGIDVINMKATADDKIEELLSSKVEKVDELARIYVGKQQSHSPPTMGKQDEESNQILATNAAIEILRNHHTKNVAQTTDPTASSEEQNKGSDKTPAGDATIEDLEDVQHIKMLSKDAQSMGYVTKNIDIAERPDTDASKQQTASFPTSKEECEESDIVQPSKVTTQTVDTFDSKNDAETADITVPREGKEKEPNNAPTVEETRDNDIGMGTITEEDFKAVMLKI